MCRLQQHAPDRSLAQRSGVLYGLTRSSVFTFDPEDRILRMLATHPQEIIAGFAVDDTAIYFGSGAHLIRYLLSDVSWVFLK